MLHFVGTYGTESSGKNKGTKRLAKLAVVFFSLLQLVACWTPAGEAREPGAGSGSGSIG
jgi:hypothetical protein